MATLTVHSLQCIRQQDVTGKDEVALFIAGHERGLYKIDKNDPAKPVNESQKFTGSIVVELKERNGNDAKKDKSLGARTVGSAPVANKELDYTSSG